MSRAGNPFRPGTVLAVLAIGAAAFILMLYAIGQGWTGGSDRNGGEHAASNGLTGFAGLAEVLENTGYEVRLSRSPSAFDEFGLLVLTPPLLADGEELAQVISERRENDYGPTLVILPKWIAFPIPEEIEVEAEEGWVVLLESNSPGWFGTLDFARDGELAIGQTAAWSGFGRSGDLPQEDTVQALVTQPREAIRPLVVDSESDILAGMIEPAETNDDYYPWPVLVVFEPDLVNNYGMADRERAVAAMRLIETAMDGEDLPIIFDLTFAGLGASENLLTLAFSPPFLAATLCLILAALVIAWRAFLRFGPARAEAPALARGKRQLARNGAALVARVKRFHLLADPYAALMSKRIGDALGIRETNPEARNAAIERALERRGFEGPSFAERANNLRAAHGPREIIRAAGALKSIERTLKR